MEKEDVQICINDIESVLVLGGVYSFTKKQWESLMQKGLKILEEEEKVYLTIGTKDKVFLFQNEKKAINKLNSSLLQDTKHFSQRSKKYEER